MCRKNMVFLNPKFFPSVISLSCFLIAAEGQTLLISRTRLAADYSLRDVDGDNIPGEAGVDYPVYNSVPVDTSFRCKDHDYAGYFGDVETGCQAYHVCFPDGRNASFLCVNGTVFHQRFFVCDWWFHFDCDNAPELYNTNLFRKIPLPVLPPVERKPFVKPIPEPGVARPGNNPPPFTNERGNPDRNRNRNPDIRNELRTNPDRGNERRTDPDRGNERRTNPDRGSERRTNLDRGNERRTNPDRGSERRTNPDRGSERRTSPDYRKNFPDGLIPKTRGDPYNPKQRDDDCQCSCDDGVLQQLKYSSYFSQ